jgi:hypothetical protein
MVSPSAASEFKLSDAIAYLNSQTAGTYQLWAFYTATVLGCLVLTLSHPLTPISAAILLAGFWAFALGELALLRRSLFFIRDMRAAIDKRLQSIDDVNIEAYRSALSAIARHRNPAGVYVAIQILGDLCVTTLMIANSARWIVVD